MLVITRAPELSAANSGAPPPTRIASVLAKREVLMPRISGPAGACAATGGASGVSRRAAQRHACGRRCADDDRDEIWPGRAQEVAQSDQGAGEQRQALPRLLEHLHHLRHHIDQQAGGAAAARRQRHLVERRPAELFCDRGRSGAALGATRPASAPHRRRARRGQLRAQLKLDNEMRLPSRSRYPAISGT
jgi:hypothetical protein